jgi:predicted GNAT family acetyltransferase
MAVIDNRQAHRYEMPIDGHLAFADYRRSGKIVHITHVEVPPELEGRGHASRLMKGILEQIRTNGEKVVPICSFAVAYLRRHRDESDLLA